ncbi:MAG: DUF4384 domain-containing protein, partial [Limnobacter sp.]|nr:DUF4384 domain-containing protein [Limnobacter sp.]
HSPHFKAVTDGGTLGTPAYMAPEQFDGHAGDARTDVYALGALAYWMITGQAPPAAVSRMVNDTALRLESSDYTEKFSVPFLRTIDLALAIMPEDRLQSAQAFIDLLTEAPLAHSRALAGSASETLNRLNGGRPAFRRLGSGLAIGLSVAIGLIALLGGSWLFKSEPQTQTNQSELPSENVGASTPNPQIQARNETKELGPPPTDATVSIVSKQQVLAIDRDWLELEIESEAEGYLSIFVLGSDQTLLQLLPKANNQLVWLEKGETFQFPSRDEPMVASGPEGTNRFVAVISTQPLDGLDLPKTAYFDFWQIQWPGHAFPDRLYNRLQTYFGCEGVACASHFHAGEATVMSVAKP